MRGSPATGVDGGVDPSGVQFVTPPGADRGSAAGAAASSSGPTTVSPTAGPTASSSPTAANTGLDVSAHIHDDAHSAAALLPARASAEPNQAGVVGTATAPAPTVTQTPARTDVPFNKDSPAVNTPLLSGQPRPLPASDELAQRFAQAIKDSPADVASQLDWQLLQFLQGQSVPQLQTMNGLQAEDREMLTALLDGLSNFRNALRADNNMLMSHKVRLLLDAADRLRAQAELNIPTVALCTDVKGYGVYDPIDPAHFETGKEHRLVVYCEVENFSSMLDEQKRWETRLTQEVVLYTEQGGLEVWRDKAAARPILDYSRNRRHDFFIVKMIRLPANLPIDHYLLKVTVVDQQMNRVAENTVPVEIVAQ